MTAAWTVGAGSGGHFFFRWLRVDFYFRLGAGSLRNTVLTRGGGKDIVSEGAAAPTRMPFYYYRARNKLHSTSETQISVPNLLCLTREQRSNIGLRALITPPPCTSASFICRYKLRRDRKQIDNQVLWDSCVKQAVVTVTCR